MVMAGRDQVLHLVGLDVEGGLGQVGGQGEQAPAQGDVDVLPGGVGGRGELHHQVVGGPQRREGGGGARHVDQRLLGPGEVAGGDHGHAPQHVGGAPSLGDRRTQEAGEDAAATGPLGPGLDGIEDLDDAHRLAGRRP